MSCDYFTATFARNLLGAITLKADGRTVSLNRTVPVIPQAEGKTLGEKLLTKGLTNLIFARNHITYRLHVPGEVLSTNATHQDSEQKTLEWSYSLAEFVQHRPEMQLTWKLPIAWAWWAGVSVAACVLIAGMALWFRAVRSPGPSAQP